MKVLYISGNANCIDAHIAWAKGIHYQKEVSITFSSQIEQACKDQGAELFIISSPDDDRKYVDGNISIEHVRKNNKGKTGIWWHIYEVWHGLKVIFKGLKFRPDLALVDSGCTHYFVMSIFNLFRVKAIPVLHMTLWPAGFPHRKISWKIIQKLNAFYFRRLAYSVIGVSPECERQVKAITGDVHPPIHQIRAQFVKEYFDGIAPPPVFERNPFKIIFVGRVTISKGVFDILKMARLIEERCPGRVRWELCGKGPDYEKLKAQCADMGLEDIVNIRGWVSLEELKRIYSDCHASIVPTTDGFNEGMAMVALESVLCGRPVITNGVVPALEVIRESAVECTTNDIESYRENIIQLATDKPMYERLQTHCAGHEKQFFDGDRALSKILANIISDLKRQ